MTRVLDNGEAAAEEDVGPMAAGGHSPGLSHRLIPMSSLLQPLQK